MFYMEKAYEQRQRQRYEAAEMLIADPTLSRWNESQRFALAGVEMARRDVEAFQGCTDPMLLTSAEKAWGRAVAAAQRLCAM